MPGLIDAYWHAFMAATPQMLLITADPNYLHLLAARQARRFVLATGLHGAWQMFNDFYLKRR
jgi:imidazolonepropionase-like amidohydrolase